MGAREREEGRWREGGREGGILTPPFGFTSFFTVAAMSGVGNVKNAALQ